MASLSSLSADGQQNFGSKTAVGIFTPGSTWRMYNVRRGILPFEHL